MCNKMMRYAARGNCETPVHTHTHNEEQRMGKLEKIEGKATIAAPQIRLEKFWWMDKRLAK